MSPLVSDSDTPDLVDSTDSSGADSDSDGMPDLLESTDSSSSDSDTIQREQAGSDSDYSDLVSGSNSEESS